MVSHRFPEYRRGAHHRDHFPRFAFRRKSDSARFRSHIRVRSVHLMVCRDRRARALHGTRTPISPSYLRRPSSISPACRKPAGRASISSAVKSSDDCGLPPKQCPSKRTLVKPSPVEKNSTEPSGTGPCHRGNRIDYRSVSIWNRSFNG